MKRITPPYEPEGLNEAERRLIASAARGEVANVSYLDDPTVRADVIRELAIQSWEGWPVHEHGVRLIGAAIRGVLDLADCKVANPLWLRDCEIGTGSGLAMDLSDAKLSTIDLNDSQINGEIFAHYATVRGKWAMNNATVTGVFDINRAKIDGQVSANSAIFSVNSGDAINAEAVSCRSWYMRNAKVTGTFNFKSAKVEGHVSANGATFSVTAGDAINAQSASCHGWFINKTNVTGVFNINSAKIYGQVSANSAIFSVDSDNAINAQAVSCQGWYMRRAGLTGTLYMRRADVAGGLFMEGLTARGCSENRTAINLSHTKIDGVINLTHGAAVEGKINLDHAKVAGTITLCRIEATEGKPERTALSARHLSVNRFVFPDTEITGEVDLRDAHFGTLVDHHESWPKSVDAFHCALSRKSNEPYANRFLLDGLTYERLEHPNGQLDGEAGRFAATPRIQWLLSQPREDIVVHFKPQPWQQAAKVLRESGYVDESREVEIEARNRYRKSSSARWPDKTFGFLANHLSSYGRSPIKSLGCAISLMFFCAAVFYWAASYQTDWNPRVRDFKPSPEVFTPIYSGTASHGIYPEFNGFFYSVDMFVPILDLGMEQFWRPNTSYRANGWPVGWMLFSLVIFERVMGAILVALTIIGLTGLLRRGERPF